MRRKQALQAFKDYTDNYDTADVNIKLKIDHTYRVAGIAERIARSGDIDLDEYSVDFCWLLGMLHDIGRFEQFTRYGTFKDAESVDHAELGADILFKGSSVRSVFSGAEPLISRFIVLEDWQEPDYPDFDGWDEMAGMAETAIRLHNKLTLPDDLDPGIRMFTNILRDADKVDIFRVLTEPPYDERNRRIVEASKKEDCVGASSDVMDYVYKHRCIPKVLTHTDFENLISQCCMAFELNYPESRRIVKSQGYLNSLMNLPVENDVMKEQLRVLNYEMRGSMSV